MRFNSNRKPNHDTHATTFIDGQHVGDAINESRRHNHAPVNHWHFENLESVYHDWLISVKVPQASRLASTLLAPMDKRAIHVHKHGCLVVSKLAEEIAHLEVWPHVALCAIGMEWIPLAQTGGFTGALIGAEIETVRQPLSLGKKSAAKVTLWGFPREDP